MKGLVRCLVFCFVFFLGAMEDRSVGDCPLCKDSLKGSLRVTNGKTQYGCLLFHCYHLVCLNRYKKDHPEGGCPICGHKRGDQKTGSDVFSSMDEMYVMLDEFSDEKSMDKSDHFSEDSDGYLGSDESDDWISYAEYCREHRS